MPSSYRELFRRALRIRLFEEKLIELYPHDKIQSPVHLSIGQEAVAVGVCDQLTPQDLVFITYRGHAFYIAKGGPLPELMAELYGKRAGLSKGKAGSMHLAAPEVGIMGASAIVASTIPHAVGAALASKLRGEDRIFVALFGDGASEEGVYHESLNFASLHNLPVLFLCENNGLAVHTDLATRQSFNLIDHAKPYGIEAVRLEEGYDFVKVSQTTGEVIAQMRHTKRPMVLEIITTRYKEHVGPGEDFHVGYRDVATINAWKARDPIVTDKALVEELTPEINAEIDAAVAFAEASPFPGKADLLTDI